MVVPNILIVGAGFTGAVTAHLIKKIYPLAQVVVWDKARGSGGRMTTSRSPKDHFCQADLGAQYISVQDKWHSRHEFFINPLITKNILVPYQENIIGFKKQLGNSKLYVIPNGTGSLIDHLLESIPKKCIKFSHRVVSIDEVDGKYLVTTENNESWNPDIVILTIPVPQLFGLKGSVSKLIEADKPLKDVRYSSRFVLVQFYDKNVKLPESDWSCQFLEHDTFRFVSIDNYKRNRRDDPTAVVFHTHVEFGQKNVEVDKADMEKVLIEKAEALFPDWPKPAAVKCHKWRYSQVIDSYQGQPGCVLLKNRPTLILGGDGFSSSDFQGCYQSGKVILQAVKALWDER